MQELGSHGNLSLNPKKTKIFFFPSKERKHTLPNQNKQHYHWNNWWTQKNDIVKYVKFLGFKIDDELPFKYKIKEIIIKTAKGSYALASLRNTLPKNKTNDLSFFNSLTLGEATE